MHSRLNLLVSKKLTGSICAKENHLKFLFSITEDFQEGLLSLSKLGSL